MSWLLLPPDDSFDSVFAECGFLELGTPASVAWRIDVFMLERMRHIAGDIDTGDLASPEEVPVLFDFQRFVPADRLQDVAIGHKAIANVVAPADRALAAIASRLWPNLKNRNPLQCDPVAARATAVSVL